MDKNNVQANISNNQLTNMLKYEFDINIDHKNDLQKYIYLNVLKKCFKSWPHWDKINLFSANESNVVNEALKVHCKYLKEYLSKSLELAEEEMKPYIKKYDKKAAKLKYLVQKPCEDIVMELQCSRQQLNNLVFKYPQINSSGYNTIFNLQKQNFKTIRSKDVNLKYILNSPYVQVSIKIPGFHCKRQNTSNTYFTMVNLKKKGECSQKNVTKETLNVDDIYLKKNNGKENNIAKQSIVDYINQLQLCIETDMAKDDDNTSLNIKYVQTILNEFKLDVCNAPDVLVGKGKYQFFLYRQKYFRRLYQDVVPKEVFIKHVSLKDRFDMCIEELLTPIQRFSFSKVTPATLQTDSKFIGNKTKPWLKIYCMRCEAKFEVCLSFEVVFKHFIDYHRSEPDWECGGCGRRLTNFYLTNNRWSHKCIPNYAFATL